jgi:peptide deformylase
MLTLLPDTDPILRQVTEVVTEFNDELATLGEAMLATMHLYNGIGLAAPQVGILKRIIVVDFEPFILINPLVVIASGKQKRKEGCLSFPGLFLDIERHHTVHILCNNLKGEVHRFDASGLQAVVLQHEIDHLNGKLFIDRVSSIVVALAKKKMALK